MEQKNQKLKLLCLHGHQTNSQIMEMQTKEWQRFFKNELVFEYLNGKHKLDPEEVIDVRVKKLFENGLDSYTWLKFLSDDYYKNVISDLSHLAQYINQNGPFDGIMGFSQGGSVLHAFLQLALDNKIQLNYFPKFVIYICSPLMTPALSIPQLSIPSLHYVSQEDELYDRQILTTIYYKNPLVLQHSYGHKVPKLPPREVSIIKTFIQNANKQEQVKSVEIQKKDVESHQNIVDNQQNVVKMQQKASL